MQRVEPWVVDRPAEVNQIVAALRRKSEGTAELTTAVQGAGGFGKTTIAKIVRADRRVLRQFRGRVYWVTVGQDARRESLAGLVNGLIAQLASDRAVTFTDARQAGEYLAAVLAKGPPRLVVLDDVWSAEQLAAFPVAGRCARLVTTRIPALDAGINVFVDEMSTQQALALLQAGLPPLAAEIAAGLVKETGRSPQLLRQINKILTDHARLQPDISMVAEELLRRLREGGAQVLDEITGADCQHVDVGDPEQRRRGVRATIHASAHLLHTGEYDRLAELVVFAEDEAIPVTLIAMLWQATGRLDQIAVGALCARLADLALLTPASDLGTVTMHGVIRDYLRAELGDARLARLHQTLLGTVAADLPVSPSAVDGSNVVAWWELSGPGRNYLRHHLIAHLVAGGRSTEAEAVSADPRWLAT